MVLAWQMAGRNRGAMINRLHETLFEPQRGNSAPFLWLSDGRILSHDGFFTLAGRYASAIEDLGIRPGDRIAVQVRKSPEALALYAACVRLGAVFLPLNTAYTAAELDYFVGDAEPGLLVCDGSSEPVLRQVAGRHGAALETMNADGTGSLTDKALRAEPRATVASRGAADLAAILYTSGTTGRSKGAMLSQDNLLSNALTLKEYWRYGAGDVLLHALPIFHTHGLFVATNTILAARASMIFLPGFDADQVFRHLRQATSMMGVPTFYTRLLADPRLSRESTEHIRLFISGSAPLLAETHVAFEERTGQRILERYGMTETNMNTSNPYDGDRRAGTVGLPLPGVQLRVVDPPSAAPVTTGETGMIEVKGPNVFSGYWRMPEKTREEFRPDGFFITGDLGTIDDDGYITIVGRAKDVVIAGGYNIYPKEIELLLDELPGVVESAVIGVPHPDLGEALVAVIAVGPQHDRDESAVLAAISDRLARFKQPRRILFVDELPRNAMGKVQKADLRKRYAGLFAEGS